MKAIIRKSKDGQFYFVIKADNGEFVAVSETYTQKHNALKAVELLSKNRFDIVDDAK